MTAPNRNTRGGALEQLLKISVTALGNLRAAGVLKPISGRTEKVKGGGLIAREARGAEVQSEDLLGA